MKKFLKLAVISLLVLIVIAIVVVGLFIDKIVKTGVETIGPQITKVDIKLNAVDLSLLTGSAKVKGLVVGNPEGYKTSQAIRVGLTAVSVKPFSVLSDKIVVRSIRVEAPEITFEGNPLGANNLSKILDNVNASAKSGSAPATNAPAEAGNKPAKKFVVDDFLITGAKVHVSLTGMGGKQMTVPLPDIHLTDLGKSENGITAAELTKRVLDAIVSGTLKTVASAATDIGKGAENLGKDAGKTVGEGVNKISKGVGGLFKKTGN
jgi:hypothetical protein